jgi:hypothetical protein
VRFIYVWPSKELIQKSWSWPLSWHDAFQDAASRIGLAVAIYLLEGSPFSWRPISLQLSIGFTRFRVKSRGTSIFITVVEFTGPDGPDAPGPDGERQPSAVDGLVLGLHGAGDTAYVVVFHGHMPPVPAGELSSSGEADRAPVVNAGRTIDLQSLIDRQLPIVRLAVQNNKWVGTGYSDEFAKPNVPSKEMVPDLMKLLPVLHFNLASVRPIHLARASGDPKHAIVLRAQDGAERRGPGGCSGPISSKGKSLLDRDGMRVSEKAQSESRLDIEKSPYRHLRSRYLH